MKTQSALRWLVPLIVILALAASAFGLFSSGGPGPFTFTSVHGQQAEMYGRGIYQFETMQGGTTFRGTDLITLVVGIPLLAVAFWLYLRESVKGGLLLTGALSYFLYNSSSLALSAAYNPLFLLYVVYFSASLFAFVLAFNSIDLDILPGLITGGVPHRGIAIFLIIAGIGVAGVWLSDAVPALLAGEPPATLSVYTTIVTYVVDIGVIAPAAVLGGLLVLRRKPLGYPLAAAMLTLNLMIGLVVLGQTALQLADGVVLTVQQYIFFVGTFVVMSLFATGLLVRFLRGVRG